jgi:succinate-semialdehyde dehydrogenase/glutarate-semialdehyde dehydrogenase
MEEYAVIVDYAVIDPATGERLGTFAQESDADIDAALGLAASACTT